MTAFRFTALATLLMLAAYFWTSVLVGRARVKHGVKAPAVTGHEMFDRAYRCQMNTVEQMLQMLPALWLMAVWVGDTWAGLTGLVWVAGRILYVTSYMADPAKRGPGFILTVLPFAAAWTASLVAVLMTFAR